MVVRVTGIIIKQSHKLNYNKLLQPYVNKKTKIRCLFRIGADACREKGLYACLE